MRNPENFEPQLEPESEPQPESESESETVTNEEETEVESSLTEKRFKEIEQEVDQMDDFLGSPVDSEIKDTVIALNAWELPTSASCEGHVIPGRVPVPWVEITAPDEPEERFKGDVKLSEEIAKKYDVSSEDVRRNIHPEAYLEWVKKSTNEETEEYKEWNLQNEELWQRIKKSLNEFYNERENKAGEDRLILGDWHDGFRISNKNEGHNHVPENLSEEEKEILGKRLKIRQKEMQEFAKFLKKNYPKYISGKTKV